MVDWQKVGRQFGAFGAGVAGRSGEFHENLSTERQDAMISDNRAVLQHLNAGNGDRALEILDDRLGLLDKLGADPSDTNALKKLITDGNMEGAIQESTFLDNAAVANGRLKPMGGEQTAEGRNFNRLTAGLSEEDELNARRISLGLDPRATGSAAQTIASTGQTEAVASSEAAIASRKAGGTEEAKLKKQLKFKPAITRAVKLAEKEAAARGETLTELARSEAALPGLTDAVSQLKELAPLVTSTFGGRAFDAVVKESGFGSTKGANARAKFIAIINNQVLPLLKETFGAAFTAEEGNALRATMGDPDASPAQKMEQLDAFIAQKTRNIESKKLELGAADDASGAGAITPTGKTATNPQTGEKVQQMSDGTWSKI